MDEIKQEVDKQQLEQATGGAGESSPKCPICGTDMQANGIVMNGKLVSGKWVCPKCKYSISNS